MSQNANIPGVKRSLFFPGQQLIAEDLTDLNVTNRELRWLHNRALHSWGIGIGLEAKGARGDSAVTVEPGYAVDCLGREIILTGERTKTVPAVSGQHGADAIFYLVTAYKEDADQQILERRPGVCYLAGSVRLGEEPLLEWRLPDELREGLDLTLAKASIQNCRLSRPLSLAERRSVKPLRQPYIYGGETSAQNTPWQEWRDANNRLGVFVQVDTSVARFHTQPIYIAHVVGDRLVQVQGQTTKQLLLGSPAVVDPAPDHFTLQVFLPTAGAFQWNVLSDALNKAWHIVWMGIEG